MNSEPSPPCPCRHLLLTLWLPLLYRSMSIQWDHQSRIRRNLRDSSLPSRRLSLPKRPTPNTQLSRQPVSVLKSHAMMSLDIGSLRRREWRTQSHVSSDQGTHQVRSLRIIVHQRWRNNNAWAGTWQSWIHVNLTFYDPRRLDPKTVSWLKSNMDPIFGYPNIVRFSWQTCKTLLETSGKTVRW